MRHQPQEAHLRRESPFEGPFIYMGCDCQGFHHQLKTWSNGVVRSSPHLSSQERASSMECLAAALSSSNAEASHSATQASLAIQSSLRKPGAI